MLEVSNNKFNNSWYNPGNKITIIIWYFINALFLKNTLFPFSSIKIYLLRVFGAKIGRGVILKPGISVKYPWFLEIGNYVWIGENVWIDNLAKVIIEDNVCISQGVFLLCGNHDYKKSTFDLIVGDINLKRGCWIGAKSIVCPGVTVNSHAVLAVSSVASFNLEEFTIYQGNPAKKIRTRKLEI
jgi:putative colanic acid biosynthesis acetyltransferase WcaF